MSQPATSVVDDWKEHLRQCGLCSNAKGVNEVCPIGRTMLGAPAQVVVERVVERTSERAVVMEAGVMEAAVMESVVVEEPSRSRPVLVKDFAAPPKQRAMVAMDARIASQISDQVSARVMARTSTGTAIAVPMEKTSKAVSFSTAPGVTMHMPERDIEVYGEMQALIRDLGAVAQMIALAITVEDETRKVVKAAAGDREVNPNDVAMVVRQTRTRFGVGNDDNLYQWFENIARRTLRMGDRLGNFMRVDSETHRIIKNARTLGIEMQDVLERSLSDMLILDERTRMVVKPMRFFAIDLQGEIERRVGTP